MSLPLFYLYHYWCKPPICPDGGVRAALLNRHLSQKPLRRRLTTSSDEQCWMGVISKWLSGTIIESIKSKSYLVLVRCECVVCACECGNGKPHVDPLHKYIYLVVCQYHKLEKKMCSSSNAKEVPFRQQKKNSCTPTCTLPTSFEAEV